MAALKNFAVALLGLQFFALPLEIYPHKLLGELTIRCTSLIRDGYAYQKTTNPLLNHLFSKIY